ncbi:hypothetical protein PSTT_03319 [Puccinia striiformis]|uniref:Uncharacterized protein n=1 Tax=Puccinia striiformis TaxID=27350 RepID=A0A2S4VWR9_9BASI|nr:hypothetical protein PSTT_03319 [Puccinia striiformis]
MELESKMKHLFSLDLSKAKKDSGESTNGSIGEKKLGLQFLGQPDPKRYQRVEIVAEPEILSSLGKLLNEVVDFESVSEPRQAERKTSAHQDEDGEIVILTKPTNNAKPIDRKPPKRQPAPSTSHISTKTKRTSFSSDLSAAEERYSETSQDWGPRIVDMKPEERLTGLCGLRMSMRKWFLSSHLFNQHA